ncbi:uncharacterized protein [Oryza sativa Japonica Group]|uniref:uncharacterized protein n=1 Tax=Oryza sativa subsp. japonica TaxID=39947 RepID=UPI00339BAD61
MAEEKESFEGQWAPSDVTEENLKEMVAHGVLPVKEIIGWRPACGEAFPTPDTNEEYALMKSDPPITQRRSPRQHTVQGGGGPTIRSDPQPQTSNPTGQTGSRKRKLVLDNDEGDDDNKSGDKGSPNKLPKRTMPRKKLANRPTPKIRTSSRKPSDIDPTGKDPDPAVTGPSSSKDPEPTAESQPASAHASGDKADPSDQPPTGNQSAAAETATTQEPPTGNQSDVGPDQEIPEVEAQTTTSQGPEAGNDSMIGSPNKEQGSRHAQLGTSSVRDQLHEAKELAKKSEKELRDRIAQLQDSNFELSGASKAQAARMAQMEKQIEALKKDKAELAAQRDSALKEVEDGTSEEAALDLISNAQNAADKIAEIAREVKEERETALIATAVFNAARDDLCLQYGSRAAELEKKLDASRQREEALEARATVLEERARALDTKERELAGREAAVAIREATLAAHEAACAEEESALRLREDELTGRERALEEAEAATQRREEQARDPDFSPWAALEEFPPGTEDGARARVRDAADHIVHSFEGTAPRLAFALDSDEEGGDDGADDSDDEADGPGASE